MLAQFLAWYSCCTTDCKSAAQDHAAPRGPDDWTTTLGDEPLGRPVAGGGSSRPASLLGGREAAAASDNKGPRGRRPRPEHLLDTASDRSWDEKPGFFFTPSLASTTSSLRGTLPLAQRGAAPGSLWPTNNSEVAAQQEALALRELMRRFLRDLVRGKPFFVVMETSTEPCHLTLVPSFHFLQLRLNGRVHDIPIKAIKDVCPGRLREDGFVPAAMDRLCSTMVLQNGECVTFRFETLQERDEFSKCVRAIFTALD